MRLRSANWQLIFRVLASVLATAYVAWEMHSRWDKLQVLWEGAWEGSTVALVIVAIALMPLNYLLEAMKWRAVVRPFYPSLRLGRAFVAVLAGMASGIWTPNRVGEYAGRVVFLREGSRFEAVVATFVDRVCQLLVTLLCGLLALLALLLEFGGDVMAGLLGSDGAVTLFVVVAVAMIVVVAVFLGAPRHFSGWIPTRWNSAAWIRKLRFALSNLRMQAVLVVLALSCARYFIFSTQYLLLMVAFGYSGDVFTAYGIIAVIFLGKSVLPVMGIFELGVREWVALMVISAFGGKADSPMAVSSTLLLYIVNILLPTLLGVVALQRIRVREGA